MTGRLLVIAWLAVAPLTSVPAGAEEGENPPPQPVTTSNPDVPVAELEMALQPLTKGELLTEAGGWQKLVQEKSEEIAELDIVIKRLNVAMEAAAAAKATAETAAPELEQAAKALAEAEASDDPEAVKSAEANLETARGHGRCRNGGNGLGGRGRG